MNDEARRVSGRTCGLRVNVNGLKGEKASWAPMQKSQLGVTGAVGLKWGSIRNKK